MHGWQDVGRVARPLSEISFAALVVAAGLRRRTRRRLLDPIIVVATKTEEKAVEFALGGQRGAGGSDRSARCRASSRNIFFGMPSVTFQERGDSPATAINIRGLQDFGRVAVVVDGARQNFQRSGHNANGVFFLDPELVAGVDVVRGPVSNIYGSGAIGGVVSFRTKDVQDVLRFNERWGSLSHAEAGSNRRGLASEFAGHMSVKNVDIFVGGLYRMNSNYLDGNGARSPIRQRNRGRYREADGSSRRSPRGQIHRHHAGLQVQDRPIPRARAGHRRIPVRHQCDQRDPDGRWKYAPRRSAVRLREHRLLDTHQSGSAQGRQRQRRTKATPLPVSSAICAISISRLPDSMRITPRGSRPARCATP